MQSGNTRIAQCCRFKSSSWLRHVRAAGAQVVSPENTLWLRYLGADTLITVHGQTNTAYSFRSCRRCDKDAGMLVREQLQRINDSRWGN